MNIWIHHVWSLRTASTNTWTSQQDILHALLNFATTSAIPIPIMVCSRQESQIITMFSAIQMSALLFKILVDHEHSLRDDIDLYFGN